MIIILINYFYIVELIDKLSSQDIFEIQSDSILPGQNVIVIDDLIATGGTAKAAINLIELAKANVKLFMFVTEIASLKGKESLGVETYITFPL